METNANDLAESLDTTMIISDMVSSTSHFAPTIQTTSKH